MRYEANAFGGLRLKVGGWRPEHSDSQPQTSNLLPLTSSPVREHFKLPKGAPLKLKQMHHQALRDNAASGRDLSDDQKVFLLKFVYKAQITAGGKTPYLSDFLVFLNNAGSVFKISIYVQNQGVLRFESGAYTPVREHFKSKNNAEFGRKARF